MHNILKYSIHLRKITHFYLVAVHNKKTCGTLFSTRWFEIAFYLSMGPLWLLVYCIYQVIDDIHCDFLILRVIFVRGVTQEIVLIFDQQFKREYELVVAIWRVWVLFTYDVYISQLIRYARACSTHDQFFSRGRLQTDKLMSQGFLQSRLTSAFRKFYGCYNDLV
jgi:hypothetical protein